MRVFVIVCEREENYLVDQLFASLLKFGLISKTLDKIF